MTHFRRVDYIPQFALLTEEELKEEQFFLQKHEIISRDKDGYYYIIDLKCHEDIFGSSNNETSRAEENSVQDFATTEEVEEFLKFLDTIDLDVTLEELDSLLES